MNQKEFYIQNLFDSIAPYYDHANTILSFGRDRYWRKYTAQMVAEVRPKEVLDICAGTGMLSLAIAREIGDVRVIGLDFSKEMLERGKRNLAKWRVGDRIQFKYGNAMNLNFPEASFDCVTMGFSLRNVEDISQVLSEMKRVLRPGGRLIILELSKPENKIFRRIYFGYFYKMVPKVGHMIYGKKGPYDYLPSSLTNFPDRLELEEYITQVGLKNVRSFPLTGGIVAVHMGEKEE